MTPVETVMRDGPVIPVLVIEDLAHAVPLARALLRGGIRVLEITLRTPVALDAARAIAAECPDAIMGVGTILEPRQLDDAARIGAKFAVSPGLTPRLAAAAKDHAVPLLPGTATVGEAMQALESGFACQKFFPAEPSGGASYVSSLVSPLPQVLFCPTGGITADSAPRYLRLPNVACVGGSWMVPKDALLSGDWARIESLARAAAALRP